MDHISRRASLVLLGMAPWAAAAAAQEAPSPGRRTRYTPSRGPRPSMRAIIRDRSFPNGNEPLLVWGACNPFSDIENIFRAVGTLDRTS